MSTPLQDAAAPSSRRDFFKRAGLGLGAVTALAACDSDPIDDVEDGDVTLDFSTDFGVLNYAYALEQLEYAFYVQVLDTPFAGITADERATFSDLRAHEGIHRDFLRTALGGPTAQGGNAIGTLTPDFSAVDFSNRDSVLTTAVTFEDLGVAAYNGAGRILRSTDFLTLAGKIVSVEARHASAIRDLVLDRARSGATVGEAGGGLMEVVGESALDRALEPGDVLRAADPFITNRIRTRGL